MKILVTGYAGFIGTNLTRKLLKEATEKDSIIGLDAFTYAARPVWAEQIVHESKARFDRAYCDIRNPKLIGEFISVFKPDQIYHLAAESHVCRSIDGPRDFAETNFMGTFNILEGIRKFSPQTRMVNISTDETFGELEKDDPPFSEMTPVEPRSPYAASKCSADLMVKAFVLTYGLDVMTTRCTNNYGPNQHEEKLIPKSIMSAINGKTMTLYGDGTHTRDWIFVDDHAAALQTVMEKGEKGNVYCVGSGLEISNKDIVNHVEKAYREVSGKNIDLKVEYTDNRPTDDKRYAVNTAKLAALGWTPNSSQEYFIERLKETILWYMKQN